MSERDEQIAFFFYIEVLKVRHPDMAKDLRWVHASMNGAWFKNKHMAVMAIKEGLEPGILDIFWAYNNGKYPGIYIEMKYGKNKLTEKQEKYKDWVIKQGYLVRICYDWMAAITVLCEYAGLPAPNFQ